MPFLTAVERKSLSLLVAGLLVLALFVLLSFWLVGLTARNAERASIERTLRMAAGNVQSLLVDAETAQRGYLLTGNESYLDPFERAESQLKIEVSSLLASFDRAPEL